MELLNKSQKASLTATLSSLEEAIHSIQEVFERSNKDYLFVEYDDDLSPDKKEGIVKELALMQRIADKIKQKFGLEAERVGIRRRILSEISAIWEYLHDSKARRLRRYGEVPYYLESELDPEIDNLIRSIEKIRKIVET